MPSLRQRYRRLNVSPVFHDISEGSAAFGELTYRCRYRAGKQSVRMCVLSEGLTSQEVRMNASGTKLDIDKALLDPAGVFAEPDEIVRMPGLTRSLKLRLLEQWEREARALAVAEEEGMTGGEESMLGRVRRAIVALGGEEKSDDRPTPTTKHG
jgi:hypothetical protein